MKWDETAPFCYNEQEARQAGPGVKGNGIRMDDATIRGREEDEHQDLFVRYGLPAYVRRGLEVEQALADLVLRCRQQRDEWLQMARTHLGLLHGLAGGWDALRPLLADADQLALLERLHTELAPKLRAPVEPTTSARVLRRALRDVIASLERFNRRWQAFLPTVDLTAINGLRADYNRYYVLEKECALGSARLAREGFHRLEPLTAADLTGLLPPLPVPRLRA